MTWTYSGDPASSPRDAVRFMIQDTDTTSQQVSDEEIAYYIGQGMEALDAAIALVGALAMKYARKADRKVSDLSVSWSQISKQYLALKKDLEAERAKSGGAQVYVGGLTYSDKLRTETNSDYVQASERRDTFRNRQPNG